MVYPSEHHAMLSALGRVLLGFAGIAFIGGGIALSWGGPVGNPDIAVIAVWVCTGIVDLAAAAVGPLNLQPRARDAAVAGLVLLNLLGLAVFAFVVRLLMVFLWSEADS